MKGSKKIVIIAGPNGAGKTTFAAEFLPNEADCPAFINVDLIATGLSPYAPERVAIRAARLMLDEIRRRVRDNSQRAQLRTAHPSLARIGLPREAHLLGIALG